jgi:hypothetical protein
MVSAITIYIMLFVLCFMTSIKIINFGCIFKHSLYYFIQAILKLSCQLLRYAYLKEIHCKPQPAGFNDRFYRIYVVRLSFYKIKTIKNFRALAPTFLSYLLAVSQIEQG